MKQAPMFWNRLIDWLIDHFPLVRKRAYAYAPTSRHKRYPIRFESLESRDVFDASFELVNLTSEDCSTVDSHAEFVSSESDRKDHASLSKVPSRGIENAEYSIERITIEKTTFQQIDSAGRKGSLHSSQRDRPDSLNDRSVGLVGEGEYTSQDFDSRTVTTVTVWLVPNPAADNRGSDTRDSFTPTRSSGLIHLSNPPDSASANADRVAPSLPDELPRPSAPVNRSITGSDSTPISPRTFLQPSPSPSVSVSANPSGSITASNLGEHSFPLDQSEQRAVNNSYKILPMSDSSRPSTNAMDNAKLNDMVDIEIESISSMLSDRVDRYFQSKDALDSVLEKTSLFKRAMANDTRLNSQIAAVAKQTTAGFDFEYGMPLPDGMVFLQAGEFADREVESTHYQIASMGGSPIGLLQWFVGVDSTYDHRDETSEKSSNEIGDNSEVMPIRIGDIAFLVIAGSMVMNQISKAKNTRRSRL